MKQWPALITGLLFGAGLALSGMTNTRKVLGFLDIAGNWDPDLLFVMGGAVLVTLGATPFILRWSSPLLAAAFSLPLERTIDRRLITGATLFGIGWGLWGYCPGPALTSIAYGSASTWVFISCMLGGMWLAGRLKVTVSRLDD
jgi:Predicted transporter component